MGTAIRFTDTKRHMYAGRNFDGIATYNAHPVAMPKGYSLSYAFLGNAKADHALVGIAQHHNKTLAYFDCANDAGLAISALQFAGYANYEMAPIQGKTNVAAYEFPLWVALNFTSVDQVEDALHDVALIGSPVDMQMGISMRHWMISDVERSIVVEYSDSGMHVFHNMVDTLANQPSFDWHMENLRNYLTSTGEVAPSAKWDIAILHPFGPGAGMRGIPGDIYSPSRFVRAAFLNAHYPKQSTENNNVARMFHTLQGVAIIDGSSQTQSKVYEKTLYTCCFSSKTHTLYYNTYDNFTIDHIAISEVADVDPTHLIEKEM